MGLLSMQEGTCGCIGQARGDLMIDWLYKMRSKGLLVI